MIWARHNHSDLIMFEQVFVKRDYDFELPFVPRTIVDAGANAGYASLYFANRYPEARILAVEPDSENFELLGKNTERFPAISPLRAGLWGASASLKITDPVASKCMVSLKTASAGEGMTVPGLTVLDLLECMGEKQIDLLKIDIEGAEKQVFSADPSQWLGKVKAIMIELHDWNTPGCARSFYDALTGVPFLQYSKGDVLLVIFPDLLGASSSR